METEHLNLVTFVLGLGHGGVVRVPAGEGGVQEQQQGGHSPHLRGQVILGSATPTPTSNIPYGQSSAKLPVLRSSGHLVTWSPQSLYFFNMATNGDKQTDEQHQGLQVCFADNNNTIHSIPTCHLSSLVITITIKFHQWLCSKI